MISWGHMKTVIKRDRAALQKRRFSAGRLFAKGKAQADIARKLGVTPAAVCKWHAEWKKKGQDGLVSKGPSGTAPKLSEKKKRELKKILLAGPRKAGYNTDFWTLSRIQSVMKKKCRTALGTGSVWRTVISLGFSCQKPEKKSKEGNQKAIADWKLSGFPRLKKMGA
jgi:transposase